MRRDRYDVLILPHHTLLLCDFGLRAGWLYLIDDRKAVELLLYLMPGAFVQL